jgi:hypothetical protein
MIPWREAMRAWSRSTCLMPLAAVRS